MPASRTLLIMSGSKRGLAQAAATQGGGRLFSPVQQTAFLTCLWRREESLKPAPLIRDPFAARLVDAFVAEETLAEMRASERKDEAVDLLACRTAFCDEFVVEEVGRLTGAAEAAAATGLQVVALGAGLCSRPYRLHQSCASDVQWFEVDRDREVLQWKHEVMGADSVGGDSIPKVHSLACDLSQPEQVAKSLLEHPHFSSERPTVFVMEGLLEYLPQEVHQPLFRACVESTRGGPVSMVMQNLEPQFAEHFNREGRLPWQKELVDAPEQEGRLLQLGKGRSYKAEALVFRGQDFYKRYGRRIHEGWTMLTARFGGN